jgi:hypothetical protein
LLPLTPLPILPVFAGKFPINPLYETSPDGTYRIPPFYPFLCTARNHYNSPTAIDSITLIRDIVTGIQVPIAGDKAIQLYPNPFRDNVYLKGLSQSHTYTLILQDLQGRVIYSTRLIHPSNPPLSIPVNPGAYLLAIYDGNNKSFVTTFKLVKTE